MPAEKKIVFDPKSSSTIKENAGYASRSDVSVSSERESLVAMATDTLKTTNQDSYCKRSLAIGGGINILAVADGIGSYSSSEYASHFVADYVVNRLADLIEKGENVNFSLVFQDAQKGLVEYVKKLFAGSLDSIPQNSFGTTLIVGIDYPDRFVAAYVGNGSILHVSSLFSTFTDAVSMPWNAINLLNPHSIEVRVKEALYKFFAYNANLNDVIPSVVEVIKNPSMPGEFFVISTDGLHSADQDVPGMDEAGDMWIPADMRLKHLYDALKTYLLGKEPLTNEGLDATLRRYLSTIKEAKLINDDVTLGVVIPQRAIEYSIKQRSK